MKLFTVVLSRESEIVVLAEDRQAAEKVALHNSYNIDDFAEEWEVGNCSEVTEGNKRYITDWMPESPYSDLKETELLELFGERDPSCETILEFWAEQERERATAAAAEAKQEKLKF